jgi:hypothetical protein
METAAGPVFNDTLIYYFTLNLLEEGNYNFSTSHMLLLLNLNLDPEFLKLNLIFKLLQYLSKIFNKYSTKISFKINVKFLCLHTLALKNS